VVLNFGVPLGLDVVERGAANDGIADQEHVGLGIAERAETIVVFLDGGIPKTQVDGFAIHHDVGRIIVEDGGDVLSRESVGGVRDEQASLTDSTVTNHDTLDVLHVENEGEKKRSFFCLKVIDY